MRIKSLLLSMLAVVTLVSCQKEDSSVGVGIDDRLPTDKAYLSLSIKADKKSLARAQGPDDQGTQMESTITKLTVLGFKDANIVGIYMLDVVGGVVSSEAFEVVHNMTHIFVVANPTDALLDSFDSANNVDNIILITREMAVSDIITDANFLMTSGANTLTSDATVTADANGLVAVTPSTGATVEEAKENANAKTVNVKIDRVVAKITLATWMQNGTVNAPNAKEGSVSITNWDLNTTNNSTALFTPYDQANVVGGKITSGYRKDHNFNSVITGPTSTIITEFSHLGQNEASNVPSWVSPATAKYCLENTMLPDAYQNTQTTKLLIKGTYVPNTDAYDGSFTNTNESYFSIAHLSGTRYYTREQLAIYYNSATTSQFQKDYMDDAIDKLDNNLIDGSQSMEDIATIILDESSPYKFATSKKAEKGEAVLNYYHEAVCYYAVNVEHDTSTTPGSKYYYGVVRNNSYSIKIDNIMKPGFSYIPNPTDPDITDPANPGITDPINPTQGYLSVNIAVNNWTTWSQSSDLY